jgi:hypothetical protein
MEPLGADDDQIDPSAAPVLFPQLTPVYHLGASQAGRSAKSIS